MLFLFIFNQNNFFYQKESGAKTCKMWSPCLDFRDSTNVKEVLVFRIYPIKIASSEKVSSGLRYYYYFYCGLDILLILSYVIAVCNRVIVVVLFSTVLINSIFKFPVFIHLNHIIKSIHPKIIIDMLLWSCISKEEERYIIL